MLNLHDPTVWGFHWLFVAVHVTVPVGGVDVVDVTTAVQVSGVAVLVGGFAGVHVVDTYESGEAGVAPPETGTVSVDTS